MSDAAPPPECERCSLPLHGREAAHEFMAANGLGPGDMVNDLEWTR